MRKGLNGSSDRKKCIKSELANTFPCKKAKNVKPAWKHRFVCLARRDQLKIPTTDIEKDDLLEAGLGEKCVEFSSLDIDGEQFRDKLYSEFPKLREGGGFQMCQCLPNSRQLEVLTSVTHALPSILKERVGNARTYLRPLQKDLSMDVVYGLLEGVIWFHRSCNAYLVTSSIAKGRVSDMWQKIFHQ